MLRVAVLEQEQCTKDLLYELRLYIPHDWTFSCFNKISQFVKEDQIHTFSIVIFHKLFHKEKILNYWLEHSPRILICTSPCTPPHHQVLYIDRNAVKEELKRIAPILQNRLKTFDTYMFSYHQVQILLHYHEIYYIEKQEKDVIFHTAKGVFHQRKAMNALQTQLQPYGFLRCHVSYLVNKRNIREIHTHSLILDDQTVLPISRSHQKEVNQFFQEYENN